LRGGLRCNAPGLWQKSKFLDANKDMADGGSPRPASRQRPFAGAQRIYGWRLWPAATDSDIFLITAGSSAKTRRIAGWILSIENVTLFVQIP